MDMKDIYCILEVAKEKNITKAADNLFLTRSAISQNITRVEKELELSLFTRTNRSVELTEAGEYFIKNAEELTNAWASFQKKMRTFSASEKEGGTVNIFLHPLTIYSNLPQIISGFKTLYPHWKINFFNGPGYNTQKPLHSEGISFFFSHSTTGASDVLYDMTFIPLSSDTLFILLHHTDPLSKKEIVHMDDLTGYHLLASDIALLQSFPKPLHLTCSVYEDSFLPALITNPGDFALIPQSRCASLLNQYPNLCARPFKALGDTHKLNLYLSYDSNLPDIEHHPFYRYIVDYYQGQNDGTDC